jgi:cytochrome c oxidase assembly protein subunit 15
MGHFLLSLVLVTNAVVLHHRAGEPEPPATPVDLVDPPTRRLVLLLGPALALAVVAGTVVTGTGPHGGDEDARRFGFEIESVTRVHSLAVLLFGGLLLAVLGRLGRADGGGPPEVRRAAQELLALSVAQAAVGWTQYFTGVPALLVGIHILGATVVWVAMCRLVLACRRRVAIVGTATLGAAAVAAR